MSLSWAEGAAERADLAACAALLRGGSRSFHAASRLLPDRVRGQACALYAFCRLADDAIDLALPEHRPAALAALHRRLDAVYAARPQPIAADRALARVVARTGLPRVLLEALLEGFAWDAEARRYADLPALLDYAARVAGSVGAMMAVVMDVRAPAAVARACELGMAMQLSNIARDIGEDARAGRLYLPLGWLAEAGIEPAAFLARPAFSPALGGVVARLLAEADRLYASSLSGIAALPPACRPGIAAARRLYAAIGHRVARRGGDSVSARVSVPALRKLLLVAGSLGDGWGAAAPSDTAAPAAARFLIDAATATAPPVWARPARVAGSRAVWVLDLFARLEQRQQALRGG